MKKKQKRSDIDAIDDGNNNTDEDETEHDCAIHAHKTLLWSMTETSEDSHQNDGD